MKVKLSDITEGRMTPDQVEALQSYFKKGGTWQELLDMKPEDVEQVYAAGYKFYQEKEFDKALAAFSTLIQLSPYVAKHWVAIGAVMQAQEHFTDALGAYEIALTIDEEHILSLFYSAQCAYATDKKEEAKDYLKRLIAIGQRKNEQPELTENATKILQMIETEES